MTPYYNITPYFLLVILFLIRMKEHKDKDKLRNVQFWRLRCVSASSLQLVNGNF